MSMNRRKFIKGISLSAASIACGASAGYPAKKFIDPKERLNVAAVGVGGKGWTDWRPLLHRGENIVALCDIDRSQINRGLAEIKRAGKDPSKVKVYTDFRKMFDECKGLNAATISTPDHMHAPAAITAMIHGCHVYVQKPLVRTIWEARYFEKIAKECGVVTQLGNQGSAWTNVRRTAEILQSGLIGTVRNFYIWTDRPVWNHQGAPAPKGEDPVPAHVDWDSWIGISPMRPFKNGYYHPFHWRSFKDFGTGAFGDDACHIMNIPFRGLQLGRVEYAECLRADGSNKDTYPRRSVVKLRFAARKNLPPVDLLWHDGSIKLDKGLIPDCIPATFGKLPKTGCLIVGDKGIVVSPSNWGAQAYIALKGEKKMPGIAKHPACRDIPATLPRCRNQDHLLEFTDACRGKVRNFSDIDVSIPMIESILVGCIAQQVPGKLNWNPEKLEFDNKLATDLIRPYCSAGGIRKGWEF